MKYDVSISKYIETLLCDRNPTAEDCLCHQDCHNMFKAGYMCALRSIACSMGLTKIHDAKDSSHVTEAGTEYVWSRTISACTHLALMETTSDD